MDLDSIVVMELEKIEALGKRIYPLTAKKGTMKPYLIYVSTEGIEDRSLEGYLDTKEVEIELNIIEENYNKLKVLTKDVIKKLKTLQGKEIQGIYIQDFEYEKPVFLFEENISAYRSLINTKFKI